MFLEEFLKYELKNIPLEIKKHLPEDKARINITSQYDSFYCYSEDNQSAERYMNAAKHKNRNIDDYKIHLSEAYGKNLVMSSIFLNKMGHGKIPFIEIHKKNFDVFDNPEFEDIKKYLSNKYRAFEPEKICFFEVMDHEKERDQEFEIETILVAGHINTIQKSERPEKYDDILLQRVFDYEFYDKYVSEYELLKKDNEIYEHKVRAESMNSLKESMDSGYIYKIIIDGAFAGIFALAKTFFNFYSGYYIKEEVLFSEFRGNNFGAAAQRKLIDSLEAKDYEFIFGTIVSENHASLKTAYRCGRHDSGKFYIINI